MDRDMKILLKLTGLQMLGLIALEIVVWLLIVVGAIPPQLAITTVGVFQFSINTMYIVIVGVVAVLISAFWLALLLQYGIVRTKDIKF